MSYDWIDTIIDLTQKKKKLKEQLSKIEDQLQLANEHVSEQFINQGTQSVNRNGMTVYLTKQMRVVAKRDFAYHEIADVLRSCGYSTMVTVNHQRLKALLREAEEGDAEFPETVLKMLDVSTQPVVACRRS